MYEIEFVVPVAPGDPFYAKRLEDFKQIGFLNIPRSTKIKVVLLVKKGVVSSVGKGWPRNCDLLVKEYANDWHVHKLCRYYLDMEHFDSKWYVAVDDDSVTNVSGLIKTLGKHNSNDKHYFSTIYEYWTKGLTLELKLLKRLGLLRLLKGNYDHDYESHFVSRGAMMAMLINPLVRKYLEHRALLLDGFSDQFLPYSARISGIAVTPITFSSPLAEIENFSLFGGSFDHIHYIAADYGNTEVFKMWAKVLNG